MNFFDSLSSYFNSITTQSLAANPNYWSSFFYVNAFIDNGYGIRRNCGFVWEPGGFAMIIILGMILNWLKNGVSIDKKSVVYAIALITTFSTAGYLALFVLIIALYIKKINLVNSLVIIVFFGVFGASIYNLGFMSDKINTNIEAYNENESKDSETKVNRLLGAKNAFLRTFRYPTGKGLISGQDTDLLKTDLKDGTNGLGSLLEIWGFIMFPIILILIYKFMKIYNYSNLKRTTIVIFFLAFLIMLFSNPISMAVFLYIIIINALVFPFKHPADIEKMPVRVS
jgi:predicted membrane protein